MLEKTTSPVLDAPPQMESPPAKSSRIAIKAKGRILLMDPGEVITVEAQGNYVLFRRASGSELLRESISAVAEKLRPYGFVRIHRRMLINISFVEEIQPWTTGEYILRIKGGKEFPVSRTYRKNLHSLTTLWLGTGSFPAG